MKVRVDVKLTESVYIEVDNEDEIEDKACMVAHDFPNFGGSIMDVDWEIVDEEDD